MAVRVQRERQAGPQAKRQKEPIQVPKSLAAAGRTTMAAAGRTIRCGLRILLIKVVCADGHRTRRTSDRPLLYRFRSTSATHARSASVVLPKINSVAESIWGKWTSPCTRKLLDLTPSLAENLIYCLSENFQGGVNGYDQVPTTQDHSPRRHAVRAA